MKKINLILITLSAIFSVSCNSSNSSSEKNKTVKPESNIPANTIPAADSNIKTVPVTFTDIEPAVTAFMNSIVKNYLETKNALILKDQSGAADASDMMYKAMKAFDKSLLSTNQKKIYDDLKTELKEYAELISKNKTDHQRQHFSMMSEMMYTLVKAFGAGMDLYHDHCPMFNDNKGAMWLSETKEIRNPYYGEMMMTCGSVLEVFKK